MKKFNTIVLGCSGLIGVTLTGLLKKSKTLFVSRTKPKNISKTNVLIHKNFLFIVLILKLYDNVYYFSWNKYYFFWFFVRQ